MSKAEAIAILSQAHEAGKQKLGLLSQAASELGEGSNPAALGDLKEVLQFFEGELRVHFRHEEEVLFPALQTVIGRAGPIQVMLDEHQSLWQAVDALEEKAAQLEEASIEVRSRIAHGARLVANHIVGFLGSHIEKEDSMLFPMAERALRPEALAMMAEQMKAVEPVA